MQKLALALIAVGVVAVAVVFVTSGPQPRLEGEITEVRTLRVESAASVAFVNFRVENITAHPFVTYNRRLILIDIGGKRNVGKIVQAPDLEDLFEYFPELGGMKDEPFLHEAAIASGETRRGLIAARFEVPVATLDARERLILRLVDGANRATEITEPQDPTP